MEMIGFGVDEFWWQVVAVLVALGVRDLALSICKWKRRRASPWRR